MNKNALRQTSNLLAILVSLVVNGLANALPLNALPTQRDNPRLRSIDGLFLVSSAANSLWIFAWHYNIFSLTIVWMLILLA